MVQSPSLAANWFAASQEIPRISRNPKVHYRTHKRPPPVSILGQLNPVHMLMWVYESLRTKSLESRVPRMVFQMIIFQEVLNFVKWL